MSFVDCINSHWSWAGISAVAVEARSAFGNVIVEDDQGRFWRICPEELSAQIVANNRDDLRVLWTKQDFILDWAMSDLADRAAKALGEPSPDDVLYLVIPAVLGGAYSPENIRHIAFEQLLRHAGDLARQIDSLPEGAQVKLVIED
jgi:hypothetical protein